MVFPTVEPTILPNKAKQLFFPIFNPSERSSCFGGKAAAFALPSHLCSPIIFDKNNLLGQVR
jgi:hypothetical protein